MAQSLISRIAATIRRQALFCAGERVGVAVSGGADSVALLLLMLELRERLGVLLNVVHLNHKLRGKASDRDEKFAAKIAADRHLPFHLERIDVAAKAKQEGLNLEDAARRARYDFFDRLLTSAHLDKIAVAHTADDQAETVLAHILRGTGLRGLGGIHPVAGHVVRPLLEVRRAELRAYLRAMKQKWREDATNRDTSKTRAHIRKKLIPLLEEHFQPTVVKHLSTLAELAREDEAVLSALAEQSCRLIVRRAQDKAAIDVANLLQLSKGMDGVEFARSEAAESRALSKRIVRHIVKNLKPRSGQLNAEHVDAVLQLAEHGENGKSLQLPGGVTVRREHSVLVFCANAAGEARTQKQRRIDFERSIELAEKETIVQAPELGCVFRLRVIDWPAERGDTSSSDSVLDRDALRSRLVLRNWRPGDKLHPVGRQNAHKLKRLLNQKGVSRWEREVWPVLTSGGVLAWARGFPVAAEFAPNANTRAGIVIVEEPIS